MDTDRFDAAARSWAHSPRRHVLGLTLGGGLAALGLGDAVARKKKRKKHKTPPCVPPQPICKSVLESCDPSSTAQRCCTGLNCDVFDQQVGLRCCLGVGSGCTPATSQCCGELFCQPVSESGQVRCCAGENGLCSQNGDCCTGLICGQGRCVALMSDRNLKINVASIDPADMLARVRALPISTWNYTSDDPAIRHIGPMAQDFVALFGVGADDRHIHPLDGQGVALAAIQGLLTEIETLRAENARLAARLDGLEGGM
jgi:hypothetical protein